MTTLWLYLDTHPALVIAVTLPLALFCAYFAGVVLAWWDSPTRTPAPEYRAAADPDVVYDWSAHVWAELDREAS